MNAPATWSETFAARYRAALGIVEPTFPSPELVAVMTEQRGRAPDGAELRQAQIAEAATFHRRLPVIDLPDQRSPVQRAADQQAAMARTRVVVLDDAAVNAEIAARSAEIRRHGVIRPGGGNANRPYWSASKNQGRAWRAISFGPPGGFETASAIVAQWQAEDAAAAIRADRDLEAQLPGYPR